jgi:hypothetical protein
MNDGTSSRSLAPIQGKDCGCLLLSQHSNRSTRALSQGTIGCRALLVASACYVAVTLLSCDIFKPVNRSLSFIAAFFGLVGCALGAASPFHLVLFQINNLIFFGAYCLLIGYLIFRSTFLARILGALMAFGGLGWMTFVSPQLALLSVSLQHAARGSRGIIPDVVASCVRGEDTIVEGAGGAA